jgi:hypothetical protein
MPCVSLKVTATYSTSGGLLGSFRVVPHKAGRTVKQPPEPKRRIMIHAVVGKNVDSWCARCKLMLAHTIEAIVNHKITRTHCNTCGAQHAYRRTAPGTASARTSRTSSAGGRWRTAPSPAVDYQALLRGKEVSNARAYKVTERFQLKEIIHHPTFGLGVVVAVRDANKVDVGFSDGLKTLVQGGTAH